MSEIDELLTALISKQDEITHLNEQGLEYAQQTLNSIAARDAIRNEIAVLFSDLLKACEKALPNLCGLLMERWGHPDDWPDAQGARTVKMLKVAIAKVKGEKRTYEEG